MERSFNLVLAVLDGKAKTVHCICGDPLESMVKRGEIRDLILAAHLAHVGRVICEKAIGVLVSSDIDPQTATRLGFHWAASPQEALTFALKHKGKNASIAVIKNGGEILPVVGSTEYEQ